MGARICTTVYEFQKLMAVQGVSFPEPDMSNIAADGLDESGNLAEAHNLPVASHGVHDLRLSLLAAVPNASFLEVHGFSRVASDRPGHGVELNWERLEDYRASR